MILNQLKESSDYIRGKTSLRPDCALTLGSGLSGWVQEMDIDVSIPFSEIPHFPSPSVDGHSGFVIVGKIQEKTAYCFAGACSLLRGGTICLRWFIPRAA